MCDPLPCLYVRPSTCPCLSVRQSMWLWPAHAYTFVRMHALFPVCLSVNIRGFVPFSSVRLPLSPVCRGLPLSPNTLLQWDDNSRVHRSIVLVNRKSAMEAWFFLVAFINSFWSISITLTTAPAFAITYASSSDTLSAHSCDGSRSGWLLSLSTSSS